MALDHYVSQVHLKRFYSPVLGQLMYAIRKSDLKRFTPRAKDVCRIDDGSTNEYLVEPRAIEEFLKTVEGKYNAAVSAFEAGKPDRQSVYVVAGFASYLLTCSPAAMRVNAVPFRGTLEMTARVLDANGLMPPPADLGGKNLVELLESGRIEFQVDQQYPQAIGIANILDKVKTFGNFHWDVLVNENRDCPFFTSDFPIAIERTADPSPLNRIVPLAPTIAIRFRPDLDLLRQSATFEFRRFSFQKRRVARHEAVEINRLLVRSAEDTVFYRDDQPWVGPFVERNRHFRIEAENIHVPKSEGYLQLSRQSIMPYQRD